MDLPFVIEFPKVGNPSLGYISIAEKTNLPFTPKRIYWTYFTPQGIERGGHAHYELEQILVAVAGKINIKIETAKGELFEFLLEEPNKGVFIPKKCWHTMQYSHNAVQMCIASMEYDEVDYIRAYKDFKSIMNG